MIGYKCTDKKLNSVSLEKDKKYNIHYKLNKWVETKHKDKGILIFETIEQAKIFNKRNMYRIFKCEYEEILPLHKKCMISHDGILFDGFFNYKGDNWPEGTISVTKIKLLEEII
jgi:hypothetical protein